MPARFAFVFAALFLTASPSFAQEKATKILFVGADPDHPHGSHMYLHTCGVLAKCVELTPGIQATVSNGWPKDAKMLEGVSGIVFYTSPAAELMLESPHRDAFDGMLKKGCGLVTIHWASSVRQQNLARLGPQWLSYLGGTWVSNVGLHFGVAKLTQAIPDHPICRGWKDREINDEYYLNPTVKQAKPLLTAKYRKKDESEHDVTVGWVYERSDGGRSFATTLGHPYKNFQEEPFRRMIVNGILWSAKADIPAAGARVDVDGEILALPPAKK